MNKLAVIIATIGTLQAADETWPPIPITTDTAAIQAAITAYHAAGADWRKFTEAGPYKRGGDYLNWSRAVWSPIRWSSTKADTNGVIMQSYDNCQTYVYQPNTMTQYALWLWSDHMHGAPLSPLFWTNLHAVISMQRADGAIPYGFDSSVGLLPLENGWVSAMEQGQAISLFVRAFKVSHDARYLYCAAKAAHAMLTPAGGFGSLKDLHPSLANRPMLMEYVWSPDLYTLDGSMFALLGLYDWLEYSPDCREIFDVLCDTIRAVLPYYDAHSGSSGYSLFDLSHMVYPQREPNIQYIYHQFNTALVWTFDTIRPHPDWNRMWHTWADYVDQPL